METKVYIQDAFQYLVAGGMCEAIPRPGTQDGESVWLVAINGRLYSEVYNHDRIATHFLFRCHSESGDVEVRFLRKRP